MKNKITLLAICCMAFTSQSFAHALWIETASTGKTGQKQEVKVFYGEYVENTPDSVKNWYSDVKDFTLWLTGPDQQKTQLTCSPGVNYFVANFTPQQDGLYSLTVTHNAKDLGGTTLYQFDAAAVVKVGAVAANTPVTNTNELSSFIDPASVNKVNKPLNIQALFKGQPTEKLHIEIVAPSGWSREITTDAKGFASFTPLWPGRYMVEVTKFEKVSGVHHEKPYQAIWRGATLCIDVK
jgi:uncharacterized GH25 family protein